MTSPSITRLCLIGATGSVGSSVLKVCRHFPDKFSIHSLCAHKNIETMLPIITEFRPKKVLMTDYSAASELRSRIGDRCEVMAGLESLDELATESASDHIIFASSGTQAISALQKALMADKNISLANKESIVVAGPWVMPLVRRRDQLRPLDSEHNAIWQCLRGEETKTIKRILLTASGGPFKDMSLKELELVTPAMAGKHPVWKMGQKITIDSATLMNKGIELIEAMNLFELHHSKVKAVVHPGSLVHGMVEFTDLTVKLMASYPDMTLPAAAAMAFPERLDMSRISLPEFNLAPLNLRFEEPDLVRFPCLGLAMEVAAIGGPYPALLVGADEIAVESFIRGEISFMQIATVIRKVLESYSGKDPANLEESISILEWARNKARLVCK